MIKIRSYPRAIVVSLLFVALTIYSRPLAFSGITDFAGKAMASLKATFPKTTDAELQHMLEARINANPVWRDLVRQKRMAVGLVDLRDETKIRLASLNGNHMMYAASLPKIAVLLAAMDAIEKGELEETDEIRTDMRAMIAQSNNQATTRMIDRLGFQKISSVLTAPEYKFYDKGKGGGLWVGKRYAAGGKRYPDPLKGISHAATVDQVCRFYGMLAAKQLVSPQRSQQMLEIMGDPELHHKFVNTLDQIAPAAKVYRKSGSWRTYHSDSALVIGPESRKYILVALIDDVTGGQICKDLVLAAEEVLHINTPALAAKRGE